MTTRRLLLCSLLTLGACAPDAPPRAATSGPSDDAGLPPAATSTSPAVPVEADAGSGETGTTATEGETLFVDARVVDCEGEGPRTCLRVRKTASEPWTLFYGAIEGFTHEEGYAYELRVAASPVARPPADGASRRLRLVAVVSRTKVTAR